MDPDKTFFDPDQIHQRGKLTLDLIRKAWVEMGERRINPNCDPGFLRSQFPTQAPEDPSTFEEVCKETEEKYLPGVLHWQSPKFFAYYPMCTSDISMYAEMIAQAFVCPAFSYSVSPSHTELENVMMDWMVTAMKLPDKFLISNSGGGAIIGTASEGMVLAIHTAKLRKMAEKGLGLDNPEILKLVGYYSETTHISTSKTLILKDIAHRRAVPCYMDEKIGNYIVNVKKLRGMIEKDLKDGLIPFYYGASVGTTFSAAIDQIDEIGEICRQFGIWLNCDAAYLGGTWICQEFRETQKGLHLVDSIVMNLTKPLFMGSGGTIFFIANKKEYVKAMGSELEFSFYKNKYSDSYDTIDYKDWQIGLNHRNNALRLYFLIKFFGMKMLRESIIYRNRLAQELERKVRHCKYFRLFCKQIFGLVCFQLNVDDNRSELTLELGEIIKDLEEGYATPASFKGDGIMRIVVGNPNTREDHLTAYWNKVVEITEKFVEEKQLKLMI